MLYTDYLDFLKTRKDFRQQIKIVPLLAFPTLAIKLKTKWNSLQENCQLSADIVDIEFLNNEPTDNIIPVFTIAENISINSIQEFVVFEQQLSDQQWGNFYLDMLELSEMFRNASTFINECIAKNNMLLYSHINNLQVITNRSLANSYSVLLDLHKGIIKDE